MRSFTVITESFKSLRRNACGFYLVILSLGIRCALKKYLIKPSGKTKAQGFRQYLYGYDLFFLHDEIMWALQRYAIEVQGILKKSTDFY